MIFFICHTVYNESIGYESSDWRRLVDQFSFCALLFNGRTQIIDGRFLTAMIDIQKDLF